MGVLESGGSDEEPVASHALTGNLNLVIGGAEDHEVVVDIPSPPSEPESAPSEPCHPYPVPPPPPPPSPPCRETPQPPTPRRVTSTCSEIESPPRDTPCSISPSLCDHHLCFGSTSESEPGSPICLDAGSSSESEPESPPHGSRNPYSQEPSPQNEAEAAAAAAARAALFARPFRRCSRNEPASRSTTIQRFPQDLMTVQGVRRFSAPTAVAIGPYHYHPESILHTRMLGAKEEAVEWFCRKAAESRVAVQEAIRSVVEEAGCCYDWGWVMVVMRPSDFEDMMLLDGCFLLQFMSTYPDGNDNGSASSDAQMSRGEVHTRVDAIARDVLLLENQIPWVVLELLIDRLRPNWADPVGRFLDLMASEFDLDNNTSPQDLGPYEPRPPHLLDLFHRRQVGPVQRQNFRVHARSVYSATELAEMGVKLTVSKTKGFCDMAMSKRRHRLGLFGELSLSPVILNERTACWLVNMAAHEACQLPADDSFAVSSYIYLMALLVTRREDVQEMRARGIIVSALCDTRTLVFLKELAPHLRVGHRYIQVFQHLQEYKQERWIWIAVHRFFYNNIKTIITVLSVAGILAGLFKTILSLRRSAPRY